MDDILKPNYNTVDLSEVELVDSDAGPRENDTTLITVSLYNSTDLQLFSIETNSINHLDAPRDDRKARG